MSANAKKKHDSSSIKAMALRLKPGEDLKMAIDKLATTHHITAGCIISCVGSLQQAAIRFAGISEVTFLIGKFEIVSLTGTLAETGSHLHIAVSDENGKIIGGHLKEGSKIYTTAEIVIAILNDLVFDRETDTTYGFKELLIRQAASGEKK